jgi:predicted membrane channel-forming protein YqfA (hemolysin III family)
MNMLKLFIWGIIILIFGSFIGLKFIGKLGALIMFAAILLALGGCLGNFFKWLIDIKNP